MNSSDFLYQIGDRVIVRQDLQRNRSYKMELSENPFNDNIATSTMVLMAGQTVTISGQKNGQYQVEEDMNGLNWTDEMFEGLVSLDFKNVEEALNTLL